MIAASAARGLIEIGTTLTLGRRWRARGRCSGVGLHRGRTASGQGGLPQQTYRAPAQEIGGNSAWVGASCLPSHRLRMAIFAFPADVSRRCGSCRLRCDRPWNDAHLANFGCASTAPHPDRGSHPLGSSVPDFCTLKEGVTRGPQGRINGSDSRVPSGSAPKRDGRAFRAIIPYP